MVKKEKEDPRRAMNEEADRAALEAALESQGISFEENSQHLLAAQPDGEPLPDMPDLFHNL